MESSLEPRHRHRLAALALGSVATLALVLALARVAYKRIRAGVDAAPGLAQRAASTPYDSSKLFRPAAENILATGREFTIGATAPFELEPSRRKELDLNFKIRHGTEVLLRAEHSLAYSYNDELSERTGWALGSRTMFTPHGMRALVLLHLDEPERLTGPDSIGRGCVTFYAALYSGEGEDEFFLCSGPKPPEIQKATARTTGIDFDRLGEELGLLAPGSTLPAEGLLYEIRGELHLGARVDENGERRSTWGPIETSANFDDGALEIACELDSREGRDGRSRKSSMHSVR